MPAAAGVAAAARVGAAAGVAAAVVGGLELAQAFTHVRWDHLLYTGSPAIGREIAKAAAEQLVPVTLELGGKCPA
ncbi:MAG TPA: aldehyde dehydrogenase family protein, partial [Kineosporiaceae bacterium]|nr:aldehyde dehydrogenase family protein [Kineosporiaceae bacterium]